jgi:UDP-glucose 4,6-dehydratase
MSAAPIEPVTTDVHGPTEEVKKVEGKTAVEVHANGASPSYKPECILITGGAGFIGSHVVTLLTQTYPDVMIINYDKLEYVASLKNLESIERLRNYKFVQGDILSADLLNYVIKEERVDTIMHFAAESHVDNSFGNSFVFTSTNVMGTHTMMEVAKNNKDQIRRFIHVSTDEVYGEQNFEDPACQESFVLEPTNPYAASKAGAELIAKSYMRSFGIPLIITRGNNVYGPHQFPEKMIPKFINQIMRDWPITLHGGGKTFRNMLFVEDVARAFDKILHFGKIGRVYNIGGEESNEISVRGVAEKLLDIMKPGCVVEDCLVTTPDRVFNDTRYYIDSSSLHALGWNPQVPLMRG